MCLDVMWHRQYDGWSPPGRLPGPVSPSPTCVSGSLRAVILRSGVGWSACPPGGGRQDALEGNCGARRPTRFCLLQSALPRGESDGGMESHHCPFSTEWIRHSGEVQDGNRRFSPGVSLPRRLDVLHRPPRCILPGPGQSGVSPVSVVLSRGTCLSVQGIVLRPFHGSTVFTRIFTLVSEWAHWRGVLLLRYLDDWLVLAESRELLLHHLDLILQLCTSLGIVVNWEKSDVEL